jgi:hypothetical protein
VKVETRLIVTLLLRVVFLFFAAWVALNPSSLPGADLVVRIGIAAQFLVLAIFVGEVVTIRTHLAMLLTALRTASRTGTPQAIARDDRAAVDILIRALRSREPETREKAHRNLRRITGQELAADPDVWERWWNEHREAWERSPGPDA